MRSNYFGITNGGARKFLGDTNLTTSELASLPDGIETYQQEADAAVHRFKPKCTKGCGNCALQAVMQPTTEGQTIEIACWDETCDPFVRNPLVVGAQETLIESLVGKYSLVNQAADEPTDRLANDLETNVNTDDYYTQYFPEKRPS